MAEQEDQEGADDRLDARQMRQEAAREEQRHHEQEALRAAGVGAPEEAAREPRHRERHPRDVAR